jgi:hypothetical protein
MTDLNERVARRLGWIGGDTDGWIAPDGEPSPWLPDWYASNAAAVDLLPWLADRCLEKFGRDYLRIILDLETGRIAIACGETTLCKSAPTLALALCEAVVKMEGE